MEAALLALLGEGDWPWWQGPLQWQGPMRRVGVERAVARLGGSQAAASAIG